MLKNAKRADLRVLVAEHIHQPQAEVPHNKQLQCHRSEAACASLIPLVTIYLQAYRLAEKVT